MKLKELRAIAEDNHKIHRQFCPEIKPKTIKVLLDIIEMQGDYLEHLLEQGKPHTHRNEWYMFGTVAQEALEKQKRMLEGVGDE